MLLVLYTNHLPADARADTLPLAGEWRVQTGDDEAWASPELDDSAWGTVKLPGPFLAQGVTGNRAWLRKWVVVSEALAQQNLFVMIGDTRGGFVRVYVNGHVIGHQAVPEARFKINLNELSGWTVPQRFLVPGKNLIALQFEWVALGYDGMTDGRFFLGPNETLKPFFLTVTTVENVLGLAPPFLFLFVLVALGAFLFTDRHGPLRRLYLATIGLLLTSAAYLLLRTGLGTALFLDISTRVKLIPSAIVLIVGFSFEFFDEWYFRRVTLLGRLNRLCIAVAAAATLLLPLGPALFDLYRMVVPVLLVIATCGTAVNVQAWVRRKEQFSPFLLSQSLCFALSWYLDLLTDLRIISAPRFVPFGISTVGMAASLVVLSNFFRISSDNQQLAISLGAANEELAQALVGAKESARVKGEFLANVSHELRTPLNSIINVPRGLLEDFLRPPWAECASCSAAFQLEPGASLTSPDCPGCSGQGTLQLKSAYVYNGVPEETVGYLQMVQRNGGHLLSVVNQILDASKLEAGKMELAPEELPIGSVLNDAFAAVQPIAARRGITLAFPTPQPEFVVRLDTVKVAQVLINLITNAVRFSPDNSTVDLEVLDEGATFLMKVRDRGIGIAPENHRVIFESFRQVEGSSTRTFGGTGLGLAISQQLVQLHRGEIWLESALGAGSTFFVRLPKAVELSRGAPSATKKGNSLILVIDDEPVGLEMVRLALRQTTHNVVGVTDPRKAEAAIQELEPQLIILDVMMPRKSGITVLQELRASPKTAGLPVLVVSAYDANREVVTELGASWMSKPWNPQLLMSEIERLISKPTAPRSPPA